MCVTRVNHSPVPASFHLRSNMLVGMYATLDRLLLWLALCVGTRVLRAIHRLLDTLGRKPSGPPLSGPDESDTPILAWFDSSGLYMCYYLGIAEYLLENFDCTDLVAAGVSGGYAPASMLLLGLSAEDHWRALETLRNYSIYSQRWLGSYFFSASEMIHYGYLPILERFAPRQQQVLLTALRSGRFWVGASEIWPQFGNAVWTHCFSSIRHLCYVCTCSLRTWPLLKRPGRLGRSLVIDGVLFCRPRTTQSSRLLRVSAFPSSLAAISPVRLLGGFMDVVRLPSREKFDTWRAQGREDARLADERGVMEACGLTRLLAAPDCPAKATEPAAPKPRGGSTRADKRAKRSPSKTLHSTPTEPEGRSRAIRKAPTPQRRAGAVDHALR
jgi:hypothetical protein